MFSFMNTVVTLSGLFAAAVALPANTSPNPADPLYPRALGIICRGSGLCGLASIENNSGVSIVQLWHDVLKATTQDPNTVYQSGEHITCIGTSAKITVGAKVSGEYDGLEGELSLSSSIHIGSGGVCLFLQGASLKLSQIRDLVDAIGNHGCKTCGSVPIHFVDQGSNDPSHGILTSKYVGNPYCKPSSGDFFMLASATNPSLLQAAATVSAALVRFKMPLFEATLLKHAWRPRIGW
jgi:hypothetical protein